MAELQSRPLTSKCLIVKQKQHSRSRSVEQLEASIGPSVAQNSSSWSRQFPDVYRLLLKESGMLHSSKQDHFPTL